MSSFAISPGVYINEIDLSGSAIQGISSLGAFAGKFSWGPVNQVKLITDEKNLVSVFGPAPADTGAAVDFHTLSSFFGYTSGANVVRIGDTTNLKNAVSSGSAVTILNDDAYVQTASNISTVAWVAKFAGARGNSLSVSTCTTAGLFDSVLPGTFAFATTPRSKTVTYTPASAEVLTAYFNVGDVLVADGVRYPVAAVTSTTLTLERIYTGASSPTTVTRRWAYADTCGLSPATNTIHIVVIDTLGNFSGVAGTVLEKWVGVSTVSGTKYDDGTSAYYIDVITNRSNYIRAGGLAVSGINSVSTKVSLLTLTGGADGFSSLGDDDYITAYSLFSDSEAVDAPLIIGGASALTSTSSVLANFLIQNIAEVRKDSIVFISPAKESVVFNVGSEVADVIADRNTISSSSRGHMDSGWKYMYDKYNDRFLWVPLCGDCAGIYARTDAEYDTWFSGAGTTRGIIKNVVKLAWSPDKPNRDQLYPHDINPVPNLSGKGPTLYGNKTLLGRTSSFSRMNVRRLFIYLEKVIAKASADLLFEFNDEFSQARFRNLVTPVLRQTKGRRGVSDFRVVCDSSVNTQDVLDANEFVGQIFVKATPVSDFIRLDFINVGQTATFSEIVGQLV